VRTRRAVGVLLAWTLAGATSTRLARADGGTVRVVEPVGAFVVTIFSAPEPLRVGPADVSVLVQDRRSGAPMLDARVTLEVLAPGGGDASPTRLEATHAEATNKLLYAARLVTDRAGTWSVRATVQRGSDAVEVDCPLPVAPSASTLTDVWPYLALPPLVVALYALRAHLLRRRQLRPVGPRRDARAPQ
jgi:hypothetical protein